MLLQWNEGINERVNHKTRSMTTWKGRGKRKGEDQRENKYLNIPN
jgi:hypothetical protein